MSKPTTTNHESVLSRIIKMAIELANDQIQDIESGEDEGVYDDPDNKDTVKGLNDFIEMCEKYEKEPPSIYIFVDGGNIQGISGSESMSVNIYDMDNRYADPDRYDKENGTPEEWEKMINDKTEAKEIKPIY